eukprot:SM000135S27044  [mRNA]  locus=s135:335268:339044:- [translate_table: standard]
MQGHDTQLQLLRLSTVPTRHCAMAPPPSPGALRRRSGGARPCTAWRNRVAFGGSAPCATSFPQVIGQAASFNASLWYAIGEAISTEARAMHSVGRAGLTFWSPNINIFRDLRWGRGQETPGEDPTLSAAFAVAFVRGLQGEEEHAAGLSTSDQPLKASGTCKHFTAYDLEAWGGTDRYHFDAKVSMQDMEDTLQPPFRACVEKGHATGIMCAYNRINGVPACASVELLNNTARGDWNFDGYITSDCGAVAVIDDWIHYVSSPEEAVAITLNAGMDIECGTYVSRFAQEAVGKGILSEGTIDRALFALYQVQMRLGLFDGDPRQGPWVHIRPSAIASLSHQALTLQAACQSLVLMKNQCLAAHRTSRPRDALPLNKMEIETLAVIGPHANATQAMLANYAGIPCTITSPWVGLTRYVNTILEPGCLDVECESTDGLESARSASRSADATILLVGLDQSQEGEGRDRTSLLLPGQQEKLVKEVGRASRGPVVLVILTGGPIDISFARDSDDIDAIIWAGYPGQSGGQAIAEAIFGDYNPGGRLPVTWYQQSFAEQVEMVDMQMRANFSRAYPGRSYRFYTGEVVFPFGHGLSYNAYQHALLVPKEVQACCCSGAHFSNSIWSPGAVKSCTSSFEVVVSVRNTGESDGHEAVLLYVQPPSAPSGNCKQLPFASEGKRLVAFQVAEVAARMTAQIKFSISICIDLSTVDSDGKRAVLAGPHRFSAGDATGEVEVCNGNCNEGCDNDILQAPKR